MDPLLTAWLAGVDAVPTVDTASASVARLRVRELGAAAGLPAPLLERMVIVASELVTNQLLHARHAWTGVRPIVRAGVTGLEIVAADRGGGITDPARAFLGEARGSGSLGVGLSAVLRGAPELDVDDRVGQGLCVRARAFAADVPRARCVGIYARPFRGNVASGDHAWVKALSDGGLLFAVVDGLGHGPAAEDAAHAAIDALSEAPVSDPRGGLDVLASALAHTRGAVASVARLDDGERRFAHASVGNVTLRLERHRLTRTFTGTSFTLGGRGPAPRVAHEDAALARDEVLIAFTDGLRTRASAAELDGLLREHPLVIAQRLAEAFGREDDDLLVLVAS